MSSSLPFFADATLDLAEAHDIADTPEATRPQFDSASIQASRIQLQIPTLQEQQLQQQPQHRLLDIVEETSSQVSINNSPVPDIKIVRRSSSLPLEVLTPALAPLPATATPQQPFDDNNDRALQFNRISGALEQDCIPTLASLRKPRWPRDISWTVAFLVVCPVLLLPPLWRTTDPSSRSPLAKHPLSFATLHAITWTVVAVVVLMRTLYRSVAGGDGDDVRLQAAHILTAAAPCSVAVYAALTVTVLVSCPRASYAALVPAAYMIRDVYAFRRWRRRTEYAGAGYASRIAFFQAIVGMSLDMMSRSLRRASFVRGLTTILFIQLVVLLLWRTALLAALSKSHTSSVLYTWFMVVVTFVAGKWATATTNRFLTLLASAGVMNWCAQQGLLLSEVTPTNGTGSSPSYRDNGHGEDTYGKYVQDNDENDGNGIPEAYRTMDASVYQSVLELDDALDDDYDDLEDEVLIDATSSRLDRRRQAMNTSRHARRGNATGNYSPGRGLATIGTMSNGQTNAAIPRSTVKSILWTGVSINFGSIAHCGLLGGMAQFIWSQVRRVEAVQTARHTNIDHGPTSSVGFQGMSIGQSGGIDTTLFGRLILLARVFARHHSDLAMTHVAAYYKGYSRAARDVATIIDQSGLEPILQEDITTHMCTCIGGSISGIIVLITTYLLLHQRKSHVEVTDYHVVENMLISFILSYTLIFTVLEPLRAAIKASFISFAQDPRCLSQAYPLIYHRLNRLSDSNLS